MRRFSPVLSVFPALAIALAGCASGGGAAPDTSPPAPPAGPPQPPRPAIGFVGPIVGTRIVADANGVVTNVAPTQLFRTDNNVGLGILESGGASGDKTYRIRETFDGTTIDRDLKASDGAPQSGGFWTSVMSWVTSDFIFHILDLKGEGLDSIADELTYVFPTMMTVDGPSEDLVTFGVFGSRPGQLPSTLPERYLSTDGIATFSGKTNGIFSDVDKRLYRTRSSFQLQANFRTDRVFGFSGPTQISPMSTPPTSDPPRFVNGDYLDFRLDGTINRFEMTYSANAQQTTPNPIWGSMTGEASGMFFGSAGTAPDETGFVFQMSTPDGRVRYFGVGAADHELASRPFLTPLTTVNSGRGPSVMITGAGMGIFGTRGTGSSITASTLLNVSPDVTASFRPGATQDYKDDNFALSYNVNGVNLAYAWQYLGFAETDNFGTAYSTMVGGNGAPVYDAVHHNIGFDLGPSLAGALDNVFLVSIMGDKFSTEQTYGYIVFGNQTAAADMPTTGSASFTGETRGVYLDSSGQLFRTGSDLTMTANFGSGAINGAATNFMTVGDYFPGNSRDKLDFTFSGSINSGTSTFSASAASMAGGLGLSGDVEGAFYGNPGQPPDEAGIAYQLGTPGSGAFMAGGGVMARD